MTQGTTTNLALATVQAGDTLPEAVVKDNFETLDGNVATTKLTNKSGVSVIAGTVVVIGSTASSFATTTTPNNAKVVGVAQETIADNAQGKVKHSGTSTVRVTGATAIGDWLVTSSTAGVASPTAGANPPNGAFALALTSTAGAGTVTAVLLTVGITGSVVFPSSAAPNPTTEGTAEWDSNDDFLLVGTGAANKRFFSDNQGSNIASTATLTIGSDKFYHVTGTTTVTGATSNPAGQEVILIFDSALTLTHNATSWILVGARSRVTLPGEVVRMLSLGSGNWQELGLSGALGYKSSTSDQSVTNSTTFVDLTGVTDQIVANGTYDFEVKLPYTAGASGDLKYQVVGPTNCALNATFSGPALTTGDWTTLAGNSTSIASGVGTAAEGGGTTWITINGIIRNGANAGTLKIQFAQNTSNGTATTIHGGAFMRLTRTK